MRTSAQPELYVIPAIFDIELVPFPGVDYVLNTGDNNDKECQPLPSATIPEGAVLMLRSAMAQQSFSADPNTTLKYIGKGCKGSDVLAIIPKEDADAGEDAYADRTFIFTRKTKHCFMRLLGLMQVDAKRDKRNTGEATSRRAGLENHGGDGKRPLTAS